MISSVFNQYLVGVPEGIRDGAIVERFTVGGPSDDFAKFRLGFEGRPLRDGTYTRLIIDGVLWMSDTQAEVRDHQGFIWRLEGFDQRLLDPRRVLINGLGIGMSLQVALRSPYVEHVHVVERDERVIDLIGPHYQRMAEQEGKTLALHHADALTVQWEPNTRWGLVWHDIWEAITEDNLPEITALKRRYGRRCNWQGAWCEERIKATRDRERR